MAGAAQGGCAPADAGGRASRSHHRRRHRSIRPPPIRGALARRASEPRRGARRHEIERAIAAFARMGQWRADRLGAPLAIMQRDLITTLAARHRLPAVYPVRSFVVAGGLVSYGPIIDPYRRVAGYVDRILRGEKPADLPVQIRPSSSWSSTSRQPRRSDSKCPPCCSPAPTR